MGVALLSPSGSAGASAPLGGGRSKRSTARGWERADDFSTDAILGAAAAGNIGELFPDSDPQWKDAASLQLLARVVWLAHERGSSIVNVDATVMLESPKVRPYVTSMRENIAHVLAVDPSVVSVKAKTGEGMDAVGRGEAVGAQAVVLITAGKPKQLGLGETV